MAPLSADSPPRTQSFAPAPATISCPPGMGVGLSGALFHFPITWLSRREIRQREIRQQRAFVVQKGSAHPWLQLAGEAGPAPAPQGHGHGHGGTAPGQALSALPRGTSQVSITKIGDLFSFLSFLAGGRNNRGHFKQSRFLPDLVTGETLCPGAKMGFGFRRVWLQRVWLESHLCFEFIEVFLVTGRDRLEAGSRVSSVPSGLFDSL